MGKVPAAENAAENFKHLPIYALILIPVPSTAHSIYMQKSDSKFPVLNLVLTRDTNYHHDKHFRLFKYNGLFKIMLRSLCAMYIFQGKM